MIENRVAEAGATGKNPRAQAPRLLVAVGSSGAYPYLEIETGGQKQTFAVDTAEVKYVWVEGDPERSKKLRFKLLNHFLSILHFVTHYPILDYALGEVVFGFLPESISSKISRFSLGTRLRRMRIVVTLVAIRARSVQNSSDFFGINKILHYALRRSRNRITPTRDRRYRSRIPNIYFLNSLRTFERISYLLETFDFEFLLMTTSTTYLWEEKITETLNLLPRMKLYAGELLKMGGVWFVSGNSILLSRDVAIAVAEAGDRYRLDYPDDVALGLLIRELELAVPRNVPSEHVPYDGFAVEKLSPGWAESHLFVCKSARSVREPAKTILAMRKIHSYLGSLG